MAKNRKTPDMNLPMWFDGQNINLTAGWARIMGQA